MRFFGAFLFALAAAACGGEDDAGALTYRRCTEDYDCDGWGSVVEERICFDDQAALGWEATAVDQCLKVWRKAEPPCQRLRCEAWCADTGVECADLGQAL